MTCAASLGPLPNSVEPIDYSALGHQPPVRSFPVANIEVGTQVLVVHLCSPANSQKSLAEWVMVCLNDLHCLISAAQLPTTLAISQEMPPVSNQSSPHQEMGFFRLRQQVCSLA